MVVLLWNKHTFGGFESRNISEWIHGESISSISQVLQCQPETGLVRFSVLGKMSRDLKALTSRGTSWRQEVSGFGDLPGPRVKVPSFFSSCWPVHWSSPGGSCIFSASVSPMPQGDAFDLGSQVTRATVTFLWNQSIVSIKMYQINQIVNFSRCLQVRFFWADFWADFYVFGKAIAWFGEGHELGVINAQCGEDRWQDAQIPQIDRCWTGEMTPKKSSGLGQRQNDRSKLIVV